MFIRIESTSGVPITRQITDQIRAQCATGALAPGEKLPSVRALARQLAVNQNTILRVYERLTMAGLLEVRRGDGTYVADKLPRGQLKAQKALLRKDVDSLVYRAATLGLDASDLQRLVEDSFADVDKPAEGREEQEDG